MADLPHISLGDPHVQVHNDERDAVNELKALVAECLSSQGLGGASGVSGRGYGIPAGSLDIWRAARDNAANELVEIAIFGDSTSFGSCFDAPANSGGVYSWTQELRRLLMASGLPNGGRGVVSSTADFAPNNPDGNFAGVQSQVGFTGSSNQNVLLTDGAQSNTPGEKIVYVGKGTAVRILYGIQGQSGGFSYKIDNADPVAVEPVVPISGFGGDAVTVTGLSDATHTVEVVNLGGSLAIGPKNLIDQGPIDGAIPAGTYFYRATYVTENGETTVGSGVIGPIPVDGNKGRQVFLNASGYVTVNLYRSTNADTGFVKVGTAPAQQNVSVQDLGGTPGAAAPSTSTAGRVAGNSAVSVTPQFIRATGIVVNKFAISGITSGNYFFPSTGAPGGSWQAQLALGQIPGVEHGAGQTEAGRMAFSWAQPEGPHPKYPRTRLAISALGINDMQGLSSFSAAKDAVASIINNLGAFARQVRSAGADPIIAIPHFNIASGGDLYGAMMQAAVRSVADAYSTAWVDFNEAIGPASQMTATGQYAAVHASMETYNREARFLFDRVVSV